MSSASSPDRRVLSQSLSFARTLAGASVWKRLAPRHAYAICPGVRRKEDLGRATIGPFVGGRMSARGELAVRDASPAEPLVLAHKAVECLAALLKAPEGIEARARRGEKKRVPWTGKSHASGDGRRKILNDGVIHARPGQVLGDLGASLSEHNDGARRRQGEELRQFVVATTLRASTE